MSVSLHCRVVPTKVHAEHGALTQTNVAQPVMSAQHGSAPKLLCSLCAKRLRPMTGLQKDRLMQGSGDCSQVGYCDLWWASLEFLPMRCSRPPDLRQAKHVVHQENENAWGIQNVNLSHECHIVLIRA